MLLVSLERLTAFLVAKAIFLALFQGAQSGMPPKYCANWRVPLGLLRGIAVSRLCRTGITITNAIAVSSLIIVPSVLIRLLLPLPLHGGVNHL
jgi:hypothetical protein